MRWVIPKVLARSERPGYQLSDDYSLDVSEKEVLSVIRIWKDRGIQSIMCLLAQDQLKFYARIPGGLLKLYREHKFEVFHIPVEDYNSLSLRQRNLVLKGFREAKKPLLIHCSAGESRTGEALEVILNTKGI